MKYYTSLKAFYNSDDWRKCKEYVLNSRLNEYGETIDEHTGKPIYQKYELVFHHKIPLTLQNVNDPNISINPDNIAIVSFKSHNEIHKRFGNGCQSVYLVTGSSCSGKTTFVKENLGANDIVIELDDLWETFSGKPRYTKPNSIKGFIFAIYNACIENVTMRTGMWENAYIISTMPRVMDRTRLLNKLNATWIHIDTPKEVCLDRLRNDPNRQHCIKEYEEYIEKYFREFQPDEILDDREG